MLICPAMRKPSHAMICSLPQLGTPCMSCIAQGSFISDDQVTRLEEAGILTFRQLLATRVDTLAVCMQTPTASVQGLLNALHRIPQV